MESRAHNVVIMSRKNPDRVSALPVPDPNRLIIRSGDDPRVLWVKLNRSDVVQVTQKREHTPSELVTPNLDLIIIPCFSEIARGQSQFLPVAFHSPRVLDRVSGRSRASPSSPRSIVTHLPTRITAANCESVPPAPVPRAHRIDRSAFPCDNPITESHRCAATPKSTVAWGETPTLSPDSISSAVGARVSLARRSLLAIRASSRRRVARRTSNFVNIFVQIATKRCDRIARSRSRARASTATYDARTRAFDARACRAFVARAPFARTPTTRSTSSADPRSDESETAEPPVEGSAGAREVSRTKPSRRAVK